MTKNLTLAIALSLFAFAPVHAQNAAEDAEDAMEHVALAAQEAAEIATDDEGVEAKRGISPPELTDFRLLEIKPTDYPPESWVNDEEGTAYFELTISALGQADHCTIIESTGYDALDIRTCEIALERGRFHPASDESGSPVEGTLRDYQVWTKREPQFAGTAVVHVRYDVDKTGKIMNCEVIEQTGAISENMRRTFEREPCPGMNRSPRAVYRDENGNPVAKSIDLQVIVKAETIAE
ncbi:energy transducer TonB [Erythrobacter sp.]|nr:energy transducer TonB [Erythrobacter sp.]